MRLSRRLATLALAATAMTGLAACNNTGGGASTTTSADIVAGNADAKVTLVEYASVTCPHCANFHINVLPTIKAEYVDTGKIRYIFREFPTPPVVIASAGHLLRRCAPADRQDGVLDALMRGQEDIFVASQGPQGVKPALLQIAQAAGMNESQFDACMQNRDLLKVLSDIRQGGIDKGVEGTPTLFINDEMFKAPPGREISVEDLKPALDAAIAKAG